MTPRIRTTYGFVIVRNMGTQPEGVLEMHLLWQGQRGLILFSGSGKKTYAKVPFGMLKCVQYVPKAKIKGTGELKSGYQMVNRRDIKQFFQQELMNPFLWKSNSFTRKIVDLKINKLYDKIGTYLNLLVKRMVDGKKDEDLLIFEKKDKHEFILFEQMAESEAEVVNSISEVLKKCNGFVDENSPYL